jgi:hypothetical protein
MRYLSDLGQSRLICLPYDILKKALMRVQRARVRYSRLSSQTLPNSITESCQIFPKRLDIENLAAAG